MNQARRLLLGLDIGSSSIKASLVDADSGEAVGSVTSPDEELKIHTPEPGWAEQHPDTWWEHVSIAVRSLCSNVMTSSDEVCAIGISYQMHGLVLIDKNHKVVRPSIIWCDSRASDIGRRAFRDLGESYCLEHFLNSPGNFTASKLRWVRENEPENFDKSRSMMLPGDYIALKLTGVASTTIQGLSEGILWDYKDADVATSLLDYYQIPSDKLPERVPCFGRQGELTRSAADVLGLEPGVPVTYRAGDQPNNAFSLNVLHPGDLAATAGTSGVIYGVSDTPVYDPESRVNTFVHVNHTPDRERYGVLLCVNGAGSLNRWLRQTLGFSGRVTYDVMNQTAATVPPGAGGVTFLPFGNGAERILNNRNVGAQLYGLDLNRHRSAHILRAGQEGIVFALAYGFEIMKGVSLELKTVKAGRTNLFLSPLFREIFVNSTGCDLELYNTDGAQGAARGAGVGAGIYRRVEEAFDGLNRLEAIQPEPELQEMYRDAYERWRRMLASALEPK